MRNMEKIQQYIAENQDDFFLELFEYLRIASVSTDSAFNAQIHEAAGFTAEALKSAGVSEVEINQEYGHPIVMGRHTIDKEKPTILVYGHYDVQPPDPISKWENDPFEPVVKNGAVFARGASDDKGQVHMQIKAFETLVKTDNLPCNVIFLIEGEEEIGSKGVSRFIQENAGDLNADVLLVSDTALLDKETPTLTTTLRGILTLEITVKSLTKDVHSGVYGGAVHNPIHVLSKMIGDIEDENFQIQIPGFYDAVINIDQELRKNQEKNAKAFSRMTEQICCGKEVCEKTYSAYESATIRPALDVNGIYGGYIDKGHKSIVPDSATAKISIRLVPNQKPQQIAELVREHFTKHAPKSVEVDIRVEDVEIEGAGDPVLLKDGGSAFEAAEAAFAKTYDKDLVSIWCGGSIPVVSVIQSQLGIQPVLMGFGLESDNIHSPNEHFYLENYTKGIETIAWFYHYFTNGR